MDFSTRSLLFLLLIAMAISTLDATGLFPVTRRFAGRSHRTLSDLKNHDARRHARILSSSSSSAVDIPLGGSSLPTLAGLYYALIRIGTPPKNYYVQVDTGSDNLWVNCITCRNCPTRSNLGVVLTLYDVKSSSSGNVVRCDDDFCRVMHPVGTRECREDGQCGYSVAYGDGTSSFGAVVTDVLMYNRVTGNHRTTLANASISFGCGAYQSGELGSSNGALDGILGLGKANSSLISQLASSGKVQKEFAHCLDTENGGGIFAFGHVVLPKVQTTPLVPNQPHYNVNLKSIDVGGVFLHLPTDVFVNGEDRGTIIDSGTTLAYLPEPVYKPLLDAVFSHIQNLNFFTVQDFQCFKYSGSIDDGFPAVTFHFEKFLSLKVQPHDYLFQNNVDVWCVGWQNGGVQSGSGKYRVLLGDLALSNKLVVYDLANQTIGWIDYNCSSSIKVQDYQTGATYTVDAHRLSFAFRMKISRFTVLLLVTSTLWCLKSLK